MRARTCSARGRLVEKARVAKDPREILDALEDAHTVITVVSHALLGIEQDQGGVRPQFCGAEIRLLERSVKELTVAIDAASDLLPAVEPARSHRK